MPLTSDPSSSVTGAAGSIVSAITADLAQASGGTFHLLDLTPTPDPEDADLATFRADRNAPKATIATRLKEAGEGHPGRHRPRDRALERPEAALTAIETVQDAGGTAHYYSVDLTDPDAVVWSWESGASVGQDRRPASRRRAGDQPQPAREGAARIQPRLRRQDHGLVRWSGTPPKTSKSVRWSSPSVAGRFGQPGPDRLLRGERPALQGRSNLPHPPADPRAGDGIDGLGRHRYGDARIHPQDHGDGWSRCPRPRQASPGP